MTSVVHLFGVLALATILGGSIAGWTYTIGFDATNREWWIWLWQCGQQTGTWPTEITMPFSLSVGAGLVVLFIGRKVAERAANTTLSGDHGSATMHGSARWATQHDLEGSGLVSEEGVVVGGWTKRTETVLLRHNGPEHVLAFAPTRSGKGVGVVLPTLLSWPESALILDIKGENYALTAGYRKSLGHNVFRFDPAALEGSHRYNPLAEVRIGEDHVIADCQNIAAMICDPDAPGSDKFFSSEGYSWLTTAILHVLYRVHLTEGRAATLEDVHSFMSVGDDEDNEADAKGVDQSLRAAMSAAKEEDSFDRLLLDMERFDHKHEVVNKEVQRGAARMRKRSPNERSGVHSTGTSSLGLFADKIVCQNTNGSDFCIADLMNADAPTSLYLVIPPSDITRLRPLIRILVNQFLTRLTSKMEFKNGASVKHYKHRLLLMLDEFTSLGKLDIFEQALAFMAGYGLKAYIIVQDLTQLQNVYGRNESIVSNCHIRIAYAPNKIETAKLLSEMTGKTTVVQKRTTKSGSLDRMATNYSESISEVARPLMTADELMSMPGIQKDKNGKVIPGKMLILIAGQHPIYGHQFLYFEDEDYLSRARIAPPEIEMVAAQPVAQIPAGRAAGSEVAAGEKTNAAAFPSNHVTALKSRLQEAANRVQ